MRGDRQNHGRTESCFLDNQGFRDFKIEGRIDYEDDDEDEKKEFYRVIALVKLVTLPKNEMRPWQAESYNQGLPELS